MYIYIYIQTDNNKYVCTHVFTYVAVFTLACMWSSVRHGRNSRDNMTCMIMHFVDGSEWTNYPDEMKNYEKLLGSKLAD